MDDMQNCLMEVLRSFDVFCRENNISYSVACGTALGYVRENDLIPWDDDVDVVMLREEYEKLLSVPKDRFEPGYELVTPNDLDYFFDFVPKYVCREHTAERIDVFDQQHNPIIDNIGIDIFILDDSFEDRRHRSQVRKLLYIYLQSTRFRKHIVDRSLFVKLLKMVIGVTARKESLQSVLKRYEEVSMECKDGSSLVFMSNDRPQFICKQYVKEWFYNMKEINIRGVDTFIPCDAELLVERWYEDYMTLPPEKERRPNHYKLEID